MKKVVKKVGVTALGSKMRGTEREKEARERWMKGHVVEFRAARFRMWGQQQHGADDAKPLVQWKKKGSHSEEGTGKGNYSLASTGVEEGTAGTQLAHLTELGG